LSSPIVNQFNIRGNSVVNPFNNILNYKPFDSLFVETNVACSTVQHIGIRVNQFNSEVVKLFYNFQVR